MEKYGHLAKILENLACLIAHFSQTPTQAATIDHNGTFFDHSGAFFSAAIAGAIVAGPVGFMAGALSGIWLGEEIKQASEGDCDAYALERVVKINMFRESECCAVLVDLFNLEVTELRTNLTLFAIVLE